jgi:hypothetical protein
MGPTARQRTTRLRDALASPRIYPDTLRFSFSAGLDVTCQAALLPGITLEVS